MGDLAFNEYSWKNSEHTVRVTNNIVPETLQKFYDILKLHGHFETDPVYANNLYTREVIDINARIPVSNENVNNRGGVRPTISLKNVPRKYIDFWTSSAGNNDIYPACGTDIEMLDYVPRLFPTVNPAVSAIDYITNWSRKGRPTGFWEITLQVNNVYPFGWKARYIGNENAFLAEFGGLSVCSGYKIYTGIAGQEQTLLFNYNRDPSGVLTKSGTFTDMFIPVRLNKTGGLYDNIFIPYMRSITVMTVAKGTYSVDEFVDTMWFLFGANYTVNQDIHFIYCTNNPSGDFSANPWTGNASGDKGVLSNVPYVRSNNSNFISFLVAPKSVWEQIFTGSGMPWSYDEDLVKSPDDGGLNKPVISGQPDNPTDDDTSGTGDNTSDPVEYPSPLYIPNATVYDRYFLTPNQVPDVKKFLFSDTFVDNVRRLWTNPAEYVISLVCYPFDVDSTGLTTTSGVVSVGGVSSNIAAAALTDKGVPYFYGGCVYVDKYYNSYLDYEPYTSIDIYIPYIGVRPLNVSQVVGHTLCIGYYIDLNTQQITALIGLDGQGGNLGQVVTQFVGSIGIQTPLSGTSAQDMIRNIVAQTSGLITGVGAIAGGVMSANPALLASGVASTSNALLGGGHTAPSYYGSLSPVSGLYTPQVAYLIINRPRQAMPAAYLTQQGFSSNYSGKVSQFSGYLECASVSIASSNTMTAKEQQEIINLLTGGIYCG